jgi:hypothetical protein
MQEISYSDVKLGKDSEDMSTALGWMTGLVHILCALKILTSRYAVVSCIFPFLFVDSF